MSHVNRPGKSVLALADALQSGAEQIENIPLVVVGGLCGDLWVIDGKLLTIYG